MEDEDKFSWKVRLKLCWDVLTKGKCDLKNYRTIFEQKQFEDCEKIRQDLESTTRPRTDFHYVNEDMEQ